ncbi:hypothetical protein CRI93_13295 [Longimonas halophila]|uniref:Uncharacterized protein n=1 Tax=Longimonas halophila TaxID=1469170 RepID=A0A2H3NIC0_9BACT|nr:hypothetical protein [Longimonas halophila]PEN05184.1 hypothetical protein CRI93_13295 [Longimonas halophila]
MFYEEETLYDATDDIMPRFDDPFAYSALDDELLDGGYYDEDDLIDDLEEDFDDFEDEDDDYLYNDDYYEDFDGAF